MHRRLERALNIVRDAGVCAGGNNFHTTEPHSTPGGGLDTGEGAGQDPDAGQNAGRWTGFSTRAVSTLNTLNAGEQAAV